ncbi:hypothetical protein ALC56_14592 [Trachymyrmex septentrionalis]|uniref:Uncharacterized protein n=1 Tax=Trachymyrmex septentrionalis TaxID=34720 RepID=A0A195ERH6_9HYME|nr:hypothetical protein ALC56_14592 [Trachymyrmex septentrionalis]
MDTMDVFILGRGGSPEDRERFSGLDRFCGTVFERGKVNLSASRREFQAGLRIPEDRESRDSIGAGSPRTSTTGSRLGQRGIVRGENGILGRATRGMRGGSTGKSRRLRWRNERRYISRHQKRRVRFACSGSSDVPLIPLKIVIFLGTL